MLNFWQVLIIWFTRPLSHRYNCIYCDLPRDILWSETRLLVVDFPANRFSDDLTSLTRGGQTRPLCYLGTMCHMEDLRVRSWRRELSARDVCVGVSIKVCRIRPLRAEPVGCQEAPVAFPGLSASVSRLPESITQCQALESSRWVNIVLRAQLVHLFSETSGCDGPLVNHHSRIAPNWVVVAIELVLYSDRSVEALIKSHLYLFPSLRGYDEDLRVV